MFVFQVFASFPKMGFLLIILPLVIRSFTDDTHGKIALFKSHNLNTGLSIRKVT